jgi:hypothetical protein
MGNEWKRDESSQAFEAGRTRWVEVKTSVQSRKELSRYKKVQWQI